MTATLKPHKLIFCCIFYSKNAVEMAKTGVGPNVDVTYKSGGKSVEELTGTDNLSYAIREQQMCRSAWVAAQIV